VAIPAILHHVLTLVTLLVVMILMEAKIVVIDDGKPENTAKAAATRANSS